MFSATLTIPCWFCFRIFSISRYLLTYQCRQVPTHNILLKFDGMCVCDLTFISPTLSSTTFCLRDDLVEHCSDVNVALWLNPMLTELWALTQLSAARAINTYLNNFHTYALSGLAEVPYSFMRSHRICQILSISSTVDKSTLTKVLTLALVKLVLVAQVDTTSKKVH